MSSVLSGLLLLGLPFGIALGVPPAADPPRPATQGAEPDAIQILIGESAARMTVPVAVDRQGPYNFIIDTGAERTVLSRELASMLKLAAGEPVRVTSMTGRSVADTVIVPDLSIASIGISHRVIAPAFAARNLGAAGLLGIDTLRDHKVTIDFDAGTMAVRPSAPHKRHEKHAPDEIVITAKSRFGQLIVTDAYYQNVRVQVVLDTGSQVTMGNEALRRRLARQMAKPELIQLTSVDGGTMVADYTAVPGVRLGNIAFGSLPIAFADAEPFRRFELTRKPALMLGMDAMRSFRRVEIDFPNREVRFLLPRDVVPTTRDWLAPLLAAQRNN